MLAARRVCPSVMLSHSEVLCCPTRKYTQAEDVEDAEELIFGVSFGNRLLSLPIDMCVR